MRTIYKLKFDNGSGHVELDDLDEIKRIRDITPGFITALEVEIRISNDPEYRVFEQADDANAVIQQLSADTFQLETTKSLIDPQPEGLND